MHVGSNSEHSQHSILVHTLQAMEAGQGLKAKVIGYDCAGLIELEQLHVQLNIEHR